jgi:hypothetical protein
LLFEFFVSDLKMQINQVSDDYKYPFQTVEIHFFLRISQFRQEMLFPFNIILEE